ncbi:MAG: hypothetical protein ACK58X_00480 [Planctomycetota bacterium]
MAALVLPVTAFLCAQPAIAQKYATESDYRQSAWLQSEPWQQFLARQGGSWRVEWNPATSTPKAVWGSGIALAGWRENTLEAARQHANRVLLEHRELLGLGASGFREIIGSRMGQTWTFTYQQTFLGLDVVGGRADVRVHMKGRVPMFGSMAFPIPADFDVTPQIDGDVARALAWEALGQLPTGAVQPGADKAPRLVIWGDVQAADVSPFHLAWEVGVSNVADDGSGPIGRYFVHARTGAVLQYVNDKHECGLADCNLAVAPAAPASAVPATPAALPPVLTTVTVLGWTRTGIDAFDPLVNVPQAGLVLTVPGIGAVTTNANGQFTIDIATATTITVGNLDGRHHNPITGASAPSGSFTVNPGVATTIQLLTSAATVNAAAHTTTAYWVEKTNEYARSILGNTAQLATASNIGVTINIASSCNAYYTGNTINFYQAGGGCSNTAFSTVIAHEWGHGLDDRYGGISQTNGLSEGWGDVIGCYLLDTPNLGSGFQTAGVALRSGNNTTQYPCTGCAVHTAGQSWMGFAWKLRNRLATTYNNRAQAIAVTNDIVVSTIAANALNQADAVREVFIADDTDGNLANGTPNYNDLVWACNQHSLPYPGQTSSVPNDECAAAIALGNGLSAQFTTVGAMTSAPAWACGSGANDAWFSYAATTTGSLTVSLCSQATWDTVIQAFSGACGTLTSLGCNDDSCGAQSSLTFSVTAGQTYRIRVGGFSGATGAFRLNVTPPAVPATPTSLAAVAAGMTQVNLTWTDTATTETGYRVERSTNGTTFALAATLGANVVSWSDTGRTANTTYWYRVAATNAAGSSAFSNVASATTPAFVDYVATGQVTNHGTITGAFSLTHTDNASYQRLTERTASNRNSLQYDWTIANVPATGTRTLRIQAYRTVSADNDTFIVQVKNGNSFVNAITVSKTSDDNVYQTYVLPSTVSGTVTVRVIDSDDRLNVTGNDSLFVDHLCIRAQ